MLYHIRNGLVAIHASIYLQPTVAHTTGFKTSYRQIQCNTSMYRQTFFPSAIILRNTLPVDVCQLPPVSFKAQLNTIQLMQLPTDHIFNCTTALFLSAAVQLPVGHHYCSYYFYGTHLYLHHGAILLDHRVGTFRPIAQRRRRSTLTSSELNVK